MPLDYRYEAVDAAGRRLNGTLTADSEKDARRKLFEQGLVVSKLQGEAKAKTSWDWRRLFNKPLSTSELILFTQQFRTLYMAGISLPEALRILHDQAENKQFKWVVGDMQRRVLEGATSSVLVAKIEDGKKVLYTPEPSHGILPGTTQGAVFEAARQAGWELGFGPLYPQDLFESDGVWLASSVRLIAPVTHLNGTALAHDPELTATLLNYLAQQMPHAVVLQHHAGGTAFFQQFLQAGKAVGAVRSFYVFQVPFVMAEGFRLVVVGTDDLLPVSCE